MVEQPTITLVWGLNGLRSLQRQSICVIVDVLSFSSAVVAGCTNGALIFPYRWRDARARQFAASVGAELASRRQDAPLPELDEEPPSLSPVSLADLPAGFRLVLPSPNGSTLAAEARADFTVSGCLRNASAVADWLNRQARDVAVVAAGERWSDGSLRVALEDLLGAGAIVAGWRGRKCVEANAAEAVFGRFSAELQATLLATASGRVPYEQCMQGNEFGRFLEELKRCEEDEADGFAACAESATDRLRERTPPTHEACKRLIPIAEEFLKDMA